MSDTAEWRLPLLNGADFLSFRRLNVAVIGLEQAKEPFMNDRQDILEVLARYVRAFEKRDGDALAALFAPDGELQVFSRYGREEYVALDADRVGDDALRAMVNSGTLPPGRGMHYLTTDHIVDITGDEATLQAQFVVVGSNANPRPENGWPAGADLMQGKLAPIMIGHYESRLRKIGDSWLFTRHQVKHSLPMALPVKS
ncbi:nuclear transport factor 2 family protein [Rhodococcus sp. NPDC059968]|uniref:nuclear transport factor 2 family protein n=1 Tax=Rhodococcus sp. NPDC059968 TaxID=3347017 RepID=UPI00366BC79E